MEIHHSAAKAYMIIHGHWTINLWWILKFSIAMLPESLLQQNTEDKPVEHPLSHPKSPATRLARLQSRVSQRLASIPCGASSASMLARANTCTNTDPYDSWPHIELNFRSARTAGFDLSVEFTALHAICAFCRALNLTEMLWGLCIIWSDDDFKLSCSRVGQLLH